MTAQKMTRGICSICGLPCDANAFLHIACAVERNAAIIQERRAAKLQRKQAVAQ